MILTAHCFSTMNYTYLQITKLYIAALIQTIGIKISMDGQDLVLTKQHPWPLFYRKITFCWSFFLTQRSAFSRKIYLNAPTGYFFSFALWAKNNFTGMQFLWLQIWPYFLFKQSTNCTTNNIYITKKVYNTHCYLFQNRLLE